MNTTQSTIGAFTGKLVRLEVSDPERDPEYWVRWRQDSEFQQLLDSGPATLYTPKMMKEWMEKEADQSYSFTIHTLEGNHFIGNVDLSGFDWVAGNCWVGIGIGEREYWGKGYGSDAMNLVLRFAFEHLNMRRVTLDVFGYNERAFKSYLKVGFKEEGRMRQWMIRGGERYDMIFMGILREEWEEHQYRAQDAPALQEETAPPLNT